MLCILSLDLITETGNADKKDQDKIIPPSMPKNKSFKSSDPVKSCGSGGEVGETSFTLNKICKPGKFFIYLMQSL